MAALLRAADLATLAPEQLPSHRERRYTGDAMDIPLGAFDEPSQDLLQQLYALLGALRQSLDPHDPAPPSLSAIRELLAAYGWRELIPAVRRLALRPGSGVDPLRADQVLHDLRGGALQALALTLQLAELGLLGDEDLLRLWFLTRDQLKIVRNAVAGIDPPGAARDEAARLHHVGLIVEKWQEASYAVPDARATVHVDCAFQGHIAERCLEFAALDRVLYNLINNAVRHAPDGEVALALLPVPASHPSQLRIGVANRLTDGQRSRLLQLVEGDLSRLFVGGLTIGGSGHGLRICADFVLRAYGLPSLADALAGGYLGITQPDERIIVWVHWPIAGD